MGVFDEIRLTWRDEEFTIPPNRVMGAIAAIEEIVTVGELAEAIRSGKMKLYRLAAAYGAVLRYAGATATDEEAYAGLFAGGGPAPVAEAINTLLGMMIPPAAAKGAKESPRKNSGPTARASSRKRTR